jgi:uncharacterized protein YciI
MRILFLVYQEHGDPWDSSKGLREQAGFDEHVGFVDGLADAGVIVLGGPLDEREVLLVVDASSEAEARRYFDDDPWVENGMLTITSVRRWPVLLDGTTRAGTVRVRRRASRKCLQIAFVCLNCRRLSRAGTCGHSLTFARRSHGTFGFGLPKRT